jgi:RNA polymerase sigma-70 factor (ECF subfamily)
MNRSATADEERRRALFVSASRGDTDALEQLILAHHEDMVRLCALITRDDDLAHDAAQAAWATAWRKLGSVRDPAKVRSWLLTIAANEARQQLRRRHRHQLVEIDAAGVVGGTDPGASPGAIDLERALSRLAPDDRTLLAMRHLAGLDSTEIGRALGISPEAVRTRLSRLVARLRAELTDV